jgi:hypothetical protein
VVINGCTLSQQISCNNHVVSVTPNFIREPTIGIQPTSAQWECQDHRNRVSDSICPVVNHVAGRRQRVFGHPSIYFKGLHSSAGGYWKFLIVRV